MVGTRRLELLTSTVSINRFYNNLTVRGGCLNTRKSHKASHFVERFVDQKIGAPPVYGTLFQVRCDKWSNKTITLLWVPCSYSLTLGAEFRWVVHFQIRAMTDSRPFYRSRFLIL